MEKTITRKGRRSKLGAVRDSLTEETPELVNGASGKDKHTESIDVSDHYFCVFYPFYFT